MDPIFQRNSCIYCGRPVIGVDKGEHVIQSALGCKVTLKKSVCSECNNGFSELDRELCSRSYLAVVASQELNNSLCHMWDVDHQWGNVLIEAEPVWSEGNFRSFPQMIFDSRGTRTRGDGVDLDRYGAERYFQILTKAIDRASKKHLAGEKKWLHLERIDLSNHPRLESCRFPPRVFFRYTFDELADRFVNGKKLSLILRFSSDSDLRFAFHELNNLDTSQRFSGCERVLGSHLPEFQFEFDGIKVLRALFKNAFNLLAHCCKRTAVEHTYFPEVTSLIRFSEGLPEATLRSSGFVMNADIQSISVPNSHSFRLVFARRMWSVISSYFGGRIGTVVRFPGPCEEEWASCDITAPIRSRRWTMATTRLAVPWRARVIQCDMTKICPTAKTRNGHSVVDMTPLSD